jgi:Na+/melibiose symporter-like transporter
MNVVQTVLLYYVKYILQREAMSDILMGSIFITAIIAYRCGTGYPKSWTREKLMRWYFLLGTGTAFTDHLSASSSTTFVLVCAL